MKLRAVLVVAVLSALFAACDPPPPPQYFDIGNRLYSGVTLARDLRLVSANGAYSANIRPDGKLAVYKGTTLKWSSSSGGSNARLLFGSKGNLVLFSGNKRVWESGTANSYASELVILNSGNLVLRMSDRRIAWSSNGGVTGNTANRHRSGDLRSGDGLISLNSRYAAGIADNGQLSLFDFYTPVWAPAPSATNTRLVLGTSGNLVLFSGSTRLWESDTAGSGAKYLVMLNAGSLALRTNRGATVWQSSDEEHVHTGVVDRESRADIQDALVSRLMPALATPNSWNGSVSGCNAGTPSVATQAATLDAVNFFREFVGLYPVTFDPTLSAKAQLGALMITANDSLSHSPPNNWKCYSADGSQALGSSNIAIGYSSGANAVSGYIEDRGSNNIRVGHRRWILDPTRLTMGSGTTSNGNSLWVFGDTRELPIGQSIVEWPAAGYFPVELEPDGRWSLTIAGADFSGASVTVTDSKNGSHPITLHPVQNGYGQNTIVWEVGNLSYEDGKAPRAFTVSVSGIESGGDQVSHTYDVTLFDAMAERPYSWLFI